jgi:hypothetical protein
MKIPDGMEDIVDSFLKSKGLTRGTLGDCVLSSLIEVPLWIETISIRVVQEH